MKLPGHIGLWGHLEDGGQYSEINRKLVTVVSKGAIRSDLNFENISLTDILR